MICLLIFGDTKNTVILWYFIMTNLFLEVNIQKSNFSPKEMHFQPYRLKSRILCLSDHHYLKFFLSNLKFCVTDGTTGQLCWPSPVNVVQCQSIETRILAITSSQVHSTRSRYLGRKFQDHLERWYVCVTCKSVIIFSIRMEVVAAIRGKMLRKFPFGTKRSGR